MTTPVRIRCEILADLWLNYRNDEEFDDFITYADLGLPLAYAVANDIVELTDTAASFINEAFELLLSGLDMEDTGWESLDDILELDDDDSED